MSLRSRMPAASAARWGRSASTRSALVVALVAATVASPASAQAIPRVPTASPDTVAAPVPLAVGLDGAPADSSRAYAPSPIASPVAVPRLGPSGPLPRVALVSTPRPVVLMQRRAGEGDAPAVVEATVQIDADGTRTLVYTARPAPPPDVGVEMGCGPAAGRAVARVRTLGSAPLGFFDEGPLVGAAQQLLCVVGYAVPQDGVYAEEMERAVLAFQEDVNAVAPEADRLVESGMLDPRTRRVLEARVQARLGS